MEYRFPSPFFFFSITPEEAGFVPVSEEVEQRVGMGAGGGGGGFFVHKVAVLTVIGAATHWQAVPTVL